MTRLLKSRAALALCAVACLLILGAPRASADSITETIGLPDTAIAGFPGPYATVTITVTSGVATVEFKSLTNAGFTYLMGDSSAAALNLSQTGITASGFSWTGGNATTAFTNGGAGQVNSFGNFNLTLNDFDGFTRAVSDLQFTLSGTWTNAASVLAPNDDGFNAAIHVFPSGNDCSGACATGFATNGTPIPEPASMALMGTFLLGAYGVLRRKLKMVG